MEKSKSTIKTDFTPVFKIYKKGINEAGHVTILRKNDEPYDVCAKIAFYKTLGYTVII